MYVELPTVGRVVAQKGMSYTFSFILLMYVETFAAVESVKAASDIYAPISGEVVDINSELESESTLINASPEEKGTFHRNEIHSIIGVHSCLFNFLFLL